MSVRQSTSSTSSSSTRKANSGSTDQALVIWLLIPDAEIDNFESGAFVDDVYYGNAVGTNNPDDGAAEFALHDAIDLRAGRHRSYGDLAIQRRCSF